MSNMVINTNVFALNSHRGMKQVGASMIRSSNRLSSGMRINTAADDAAGLAISEKMRAQIRGLDQASRNAQDAISLAQTAEGGMNEIGSMVTRIRELIVQASNDTNDFATGDREKINNEVQQLLEEINSMADRVEFNAKKLINGKYNGNVGTLTEMKATYFSINTAGAYVTALITVASAQSAVVASSVLYFQIGANAQQGLHLNINKLDVSGLRLDRLFNANFASAINADGGSRISAFLKAADVAVKLVANERAKLGSVQNRLEYSIKSLDITSENLSASESRIRDADMAKEMMNLTKTNVLQQAATAMLTQANQVPQNILQLLR